MDVLMQTSMRVGYPLPTTLAEVRVLALLVDDLPEL